MKETKSEGWIIGIVLVLSTLARAMGWIDEETFKQLATYLPLGYGGFRTAVKMTDKLGPQKEVTPDPSLGDKVGEILADKLDGLMDKVLEKIDPNKTEPDKASP